MHPIHVLVVEDSKIVQLAMKSSLLEQGCTVDLASNAEDALEKAQDCHYDVILMDIALGNGPDGFDTAAQIRTSSALNRKTSIAAVSAYSEQEYRDKAGEVGMVGYFNKPFTQKHAEKIVGFIRNNRLIRIIDHMK
jgi:CheY-like chemotaxis protein